MTGGCLLVTGAAGFVGRHVAAVARDAGYEVHATTRRLPDRTDEGVAWHEVDLLSSDDAIRLIHSIRPTHILHAAWETTHGSYWTSSRNVLWAAATARLAHCFAEAGGSRFVLVGSCAEYNWSQGVMVEDMTPARPHTLYGASKLATHDLLQALAHGSGFTAATGRIFFAYGPHENASRLIPYIAQSLIRGEPALLSSGRQVRDFLHVSDVAEALLALLADTGAGAFNIGMGEPVRLCEIAALLGQASGRPELIQLGARPDRADDGPILVPDTARLRGLGWMPGHSLAAGLADAYAWWHGHLDATAHG